MNDIFKGVVKKGAMKKTILLCIVVIISAAILSTYAKWDVLKGDKALYFSQELSLKELAQRNNVPIKEILHILSHEDMNAWRLSRNIPIKNLAINPADIKDALHHIKEENTPIIDIVKYTLWAVLISFVLIVVLTRKKIKRLRVIILLLTVFLFGIILGSTPNPMESIVKLFKMFNGMERDPKALWISFALFTIFSLLGTKLLCGWGCPLGALQESIFNIPIFRRKHNIQVPFVISLTIRLSVFVAFIFLLFGFGYGVVTGIKNFVIYHHINYFKIFNFHELATIALYTFPILVMASLLIYRPFCQFICPFGLYSWLLENISIKRIKIIEDKCIKCGKCVKACPTQAMKGIYEKKRKYFLPDCWSCGNCIDACPTNAIEYRK